VRAGAICYLDEIVEARKDTTVVIHPLTDSRRALPVEKRGEYLTAPPDFMLVISYNPGYQSVLKEMKPSTRQRFVAVDFDYPQAEVEARIVAHEGGVDAATAGRNWSSSAASRASSRAPGSTKAPAPACWCMRRS
jgi:nitric oxide reductase NorQ protein